MPVSYLPVNKLAALAVVFSFTSPAIADSVYQSQPAFSPTVYGIAVADIGTGLSDGDLRRMSYYSGKALSALYALNSEPESADQNIITLRQKVQRLLDAGEKCGVSIEDSAVFFEAYVAENNTAQLPGYLLGNNGQIDAQQLFLSVSNYNTANAPTQIDTSAIDNADLAAISSIAINNSPVEAEPLTMQLSVVVFDEAYSELPVISGDTLPAARAILSRVKMRGNDWVIEVQPGDSLGQYATALYGDTLLFRRIYEANTNILATPNTITVGQELILPKNL